jgi:hypothetical protein
VFIAIGAVVRRTVPEVDARQAEWPVESWARRTRFTGVVVLFAVSLTLVLVLPGITAGVSGVLMVVAGVWFWLPVVIRSGRTFAEGYRSGS